MRTKEIDVWMTETQAKLFNTHGFAEIRKEHNEITTIKAKLIIELPERRVEITESQFDELLNQMRKDGCLPSFNELKEKLFKEQA